MNDTTTEDDALDGCEIDFESEAVDDIESELLALFPDGDPSKEAEWRALFPEVTDA